MQQSPENIKRRLLACTDGEFNVLDTGTCLSLLNELDQIQITKTILEETRLGKIVNDIRRKSKNAELAKGFKDLVKKWRVICQTPPKVTDSSDPSSQPTQNGRQSPANSVQSLGRTRKDKRPCSTLSSGNSSPIAVHSAPVTPSTISQHTRVLSPTITTSKGKDSSWNHRSLVNRHTSLRKDINYHTVVDSVPKTIASNKRPREDNASGLFPVSKKAKLNGFDDECSRDSIISAVSVDRISHTSHDGVANSVQPTSQQSIRKGKRRRTQDSVVPGTSLDSLKQKMAVIGSKSSKVKTTSEIVAELAEKKGDLKLAKQATILSKSRVYANESFSEGKRAHLERFLKSKPDASVIDEIDLVDDDDDMRCSSRSSAPSIEIIEVKTKEEPSQVQNPHSPVSNMDLLGIEETESPAEILARLPTISLERLSIETPPPDHVLPEHYEPVPDKEVLIDKAMHVDKTKLNALHNSNIDGENGSFNIDSRFKEWHEVITRKSYQDSPLVMLPYVVLDF